MIDTNGYPEALAEVLEDFQWINDRNERTEMLIHYADQFKPAPESVVSQPYPEANRVPACESEAFVWAEQQPGGAVQYYFAVENPQGLSAMALAAILDQTLSGARPEEIVNISPELVFELFGSDLSMGKGQGLTGMVAMVRAFAKDMLARER